MATTEETTADLRKQGMTNIKRITIRKSSEQIVTSTFIRAFNQSHISKEVKIGCCFEKIEKFILATRKWFKYLKNLEFSGGRLIFAKYGGKDTDHTEGECSNEKKCPKCRKDPQATSRSSDIYKKEKEELEVKHKKNMSFLEAREIVRSYMGENTYASVTHRKGPINQDNEYRFLVDKLIQMESNDWSKFPEKLKNYNWPNFRNNSLTN